MNWRIVIILALCPFTAKAMDCSSFANNINAPLNEQVVMELAKTSENTMGDSLQGVERPVLPLADNFRIFDHAVLNSFQEFCHVGPSGDQIFDRFMKTETPKHTWNKVQTAYVVVMYATVKHMMDQKWAESKQSCQPHLKKLVQDYLKACEN